MHQAILHLVYARKISPDQALIMSSECRQKSDLSALNNLNILAVHRLPGVARNAATALELSRYLRQISQSDHTPQVYRNTPSLPNNLACILSAIRRYSKHLTPKESQTLRDYKMYDQDLVRSIVQTEWQRSVDSDHMARCVRALSLLEIHRAEIEDYEEVDL